MTRIIAHLMVSIAFVVAAASGCGTSAPARFYTLGRYGGLRRRGAHALPDHGRPGLGPR